MTSQVSSEKQSLGKIELLKLFGLSLGDVINLNRLAIQAADMTSAQQIDVKIGASVLTTNGYMYQGTNIEQYSAYGASLTAEDNAIFKAFSEGQTQIKAISVHCKHLHREDIDSLKHTHSNNGFNSSSLISPRLN